MLHGDLTDPRRGHTGHGEQVARSVHGRALGRQQISQGGGGGRAHRDALPGATSGELREALRRDQLAAADDDQLVGGVLHLRHEMAGDEHRSALGSETPEQLTHPLHAFRVEAVERFVEEQYRGFAEQGASDAEPLLHPERESADAAPGDLGEADLPQHLLHPALRDAVGAGQGGQLRHRAAPAVHIVRVEKGADMTQAAGAVAKGTAVDGDGAAGGLMQAEDHPQSGALAGAVRTEKPGHPAGPHGEGQIFDGRGAAVSLRELVDFDHGDNRAGGRPRPSSDHR